MIVKEAWVLKRSLQITLILLLSLFVVFNACVLDITSLSPKFIKGTAGDRDPYNNPAETDFSTSVQNELTPIEIKVRVLDCAGHAMEGVTSMPSITNIYFDLGGLLTRMDF